MTFFKEKHDEGKTRSIKALGDLINVIRFQEAPCNCLLMKTKRSVIGLYPLTFSSNLQVFLLFVTDWLAEINSTGKI